MMFYEKDRFYIFIFFLYIHFRRFVKNKYLQIIWSIICIHKKYVLHLSKEKLRRECSFLKRFYSEMVLLCTPGWISFLKNCYYFVVFGYMSKVLCACLCSLAQLKLYRQWLNLIIKKPFPRTLSLKLPKTGWELNTTVSPQTCCVF